MRGPLGECAHILREVRTRLRTRGPRAIPVTLTACGGILALQLLQHQHATTPWVNRLGGVYASLPWWQALLRTPVSLFVPDPWLPVWGLLLQVAVVFAIAETTIGPRRTLTIALLATLAGTSFARCSLWAAPRWPPGLLPADLLVRDTGPSAAVVALGVFVAVRHRAWWTTALIITAMTVEVVSLPNLAGYEHLTAITAVLLLTAVRPTPGPTEPVTLTR
ncbi:hypothetical protein [Actinacidiphila epipremni]|uniref:Peptidase S54 rhomboid domain-containing protein n=1 Tax=Actinacidiphila epipremni TaxID=2053013 RepID=A0ABX0ZPJ2_9ACTN|nr:hypothetical protein [Actinacidiphila epipremni]NJP44940.1 hypothetical protein [Actinacidiphila epipremni]